MKLNGNKRKAPDKGRPAKPRLKLFGGGAKRWQKILFIVALSLAVLAVAVFIIVKCVIKPPSEPEKPSDPAQSESNDPSAPPKTYVGTDVVTDPEGNEIVVETEHPASVNENIYNILVFGSSDGGGTTDTMMLVSYDSLNQTANILSLPRDTLITTSGGGAKLNSAYATGGTDKLVSTVEGLVGFKIDYYIYGDLAGFERVVDAIGGVEYDIPFRMYYTDPAQSLVIDFEPGLQTLNGAQARALIRWRQNNKGYHTTESSYYSNLGDIGRIELQQRFLTAVVKQVLNVKNIAKINEFSEILKEYTETNLTLGNLAWFGMEVLSNVEASDIAFHTPAGGGFNYPLSSGGVISYWTLYLTHTAENGEADGLLDILNAYFDPYLDSNGNPVEITASDLSIITYSQGSAWAAERAAALGR